MPNFANPKKKVELMLSACALYGKHRPAIHDFCQFLCSYAFHPELNTVMVIKVGHRTDSGFIPMLNTGMRKNNLISLKEDEYGLFVSFREYKKSFDYCALSFSDLASATVEETVSDRQDHIVIHIRTQSCLDYVIDFIEYYS